MVLREKHKTSKAEFEKKLEHYAEPSTVQPNIGFIILDDSVLIQELKESSFSTCEDLVKIFLKILLGIGRQKPCLKNSTDI